MNGVNSLYEYAIVVESVPHTEFKISKLHSFEMRIINNLNFTS